MPPHQFLKVLILLNIITVICPGPLQLWNFELVELNTNSSDGNLLDLDLRIVRLGRGRYGFSGFMDLKIDLYNDVLVGATIERSKTRDGPFGRFPMLIENQTISNVMNRFYKTLIQPTTKKCCENAPLVEGTFKAPFTKRHMKFNGCTLSTDNLPNIIMEGYYKFRLLIYGPFEAYIECISYVYNKVL